MALSDSTTIKLWSAATVSPTCTKISATVALSTPKSGTATSTCADAVVCGADAVAALAVAAAASADAT